MTHRKEDSCLKLISSSGFLTILFLPLLLASRYWRRCGLPRFSLLITNLRSSCNLQGLAPLWSGLCLSLSGWFGASAQLITSLKASLILSQVHQLWRYVVSLICLLLCLCTPQLSLAQDNLNLPPRFKACAAYQTEIEKAVSKRWPADFQYPAVWRAQLYQESLCNPKAKSSAGAVGFAQFMRATQREVAERLGIDFDRFDARQSIDAGAYYQNRMMHVFRRRYREPEQAYELGAASYNSGLGSVLNAQRRCNNARLWEDISPCQKQVTGVHAAETITYVSRIKRWTDDAEQQRPWNVPAMWRRDLTQRRRMDLFSRVPVRRWFTGQSWCTYFPLWGGWATAGHCRDEIEQGGTPPPFLQGLKVYHKAGVIDAALYGVTFPSKPPPRMLRGMSLETIGFPAGADALTYRQGKVYVTRQDGGEAYEQGGTIIVFEVGPRPTFEREPVVGGQSGSPGFDVSDQPRCIVVNQNGLTDLTGDGRPDNSMDCVDLSDVWEVLK